MLKLINNTSIKGVSGRSRQFYITLSFAIIFGLIGTALIFNSKAATGDNALEPENGVISAPATTVTDANASGGKYVKFKSASGGACAVSTPNVPDGPDPWGGCFPGPSNTGVPTGVTLTDLTPSGCTITADNTVIDSKNVNCSVLVIAANNVQIVNSKINGYPWVSTPGSGTFTVTDSEINSPYGSTESLGKSGFTVTRAKIHGGRRGVWCEYNCTLKDSYIYGQDIGVLNCSTPGCAIHEAAARMGSGTAQNFLHNTLWCDAKQVPANDPNAPGDTSGCSADLTGYGDFAPIQYNTVDKNLFVATQSGGACAYGGSSGDDGSKPYGNQAKNQIFTNNIFQKRNSTQNSGLCGVYFPITDFDSTRPGSVWNNNKWDDGTVVPPAN